MKKHQKDQISEDESDSDARPSTSTSSGHKKLNNSFNNMKSRADSSDSDSSSSSDSSSASEDGPAMNQTVRLEENNRQSTSPSKKVNLDPLEKFISINPDYRIVQLENELSPDDEVSLLQIPKGVDPELFIGKSINFDSKTKIKINKVKYIINPINEEGEPIHILTDKVRTIHPLATLKMQTYVKDKYKSNVTTPEPSKCPLPAKLNDSRHPLFGKDYKKEIILDEEVEKKLNSTIESIVEESKKKKRKKAKVKQEVVEPIDETVQEEEEEEAKRQELIFQFLKSRSSKTQERTNEDSQQIKKKKKNTIGNSTVIPDLDLTDFDKNLVEDSPKMKKNKKSNAVINSTVIPDLHLPNFDLDISTICSQDSAGTDGETHAVKKKKKKDKKAEVQRIKQEVFEETLDSKLGKRHKINESVDEVNGPSLKKKRKKSKEIKADPDGEQSHLISNILDKIKSEINTPNHKSKKKHS